VRSRYLPRVRKIFLVIVLAIFLAAAGHAWFEMEEKEAKAGGGGHG